MNDAFEDTFKEINESYKLSVFFNLSIYITQASFCKSTCQELSLIFHGI